MIIYFKIWSKVIRKFITFKYLSVITLIFFLSLFFIYLFIGKSIINSLIILFVLISIDSSVRLALFYKKLINLNLYDLIKLKPIDPLIGLLIYNHNPLDIVILFPVLIFIKFKNYKK